MSTISLGLERITQLLDAIGNPQNNIPIVIHVAGTNGKGSVCATIASILVAANVNTGQFTSPHMIVPRDSISINYKTISEDTYQHACMIVEERSNQLQSPPSPFEKMVATGLLCFKQCKVQAAVIEVGMGGKLDATNVFPSPDVCVFTTIAYDHMEFLGDTIEKIATEKAGIMKPRVNCVIGPQEYSGALRVLQESADKLSCKTHLVERAILNAMNTSSGIMTATSSFLDAPITFDSPLLGKHQLDNIATALRAVGVLASIHPNLGLDTMTVIQGVESTKWEGRLQWVSIGNQRILVDGAHNTQGARALREFLDSIGAQQSNVCWIFASKEGKSLSEIIPVLFKDGDHIVSTTFSTPEGMPWVKSGDPKVIKAALLQANLHCEYHEAFDLTEAVFEILPAKSEKMLKVVAGSLYLVADMMRLVERTI